VAGSDRHAPAGRSPRKNLWNPIDIFTLAELKPWWSMRFGEAKQGSIHGSPGRHPMWILRLPGTDGHSLEDSTGTVGAWPWASSKKGHTTWRLGALTESARVAD